MGFTWYHDNQPIEVQDSLYTLHDGPCSLPPLQSRSRYLYARRGEVYCGKHFFSLFVMQLDPKPLCAQCEHLMLQSTSLCMLAMSDVLLLLC